MSVCMRRGGGCPWTAELVTWMQLGGLRSLGPASDCRSAGHKAETEVCVYVCANQAHAAGRGPYGASLPVLMCRSSFRTVGPDVDPAAQPQLTYAPAPGRGSLAPLPPPLHLQAPRAACPPSAMCTAPRTGTRSSASTGARWVAARAWYPVL